MSEAAAYDRTWSLVLKIYALPGVRPACLALQSDLDVDVVMVLFSLALGCGGSEPLTAPEVAAADAMLRPWRDAAIKPLRRIRTTLKEGVANVPAGDAELIRQSVKKLEIAAEEAAFAMLFRAYSPSSRRPVSGSWTTGAIAAVVAYFAEAATGGARPASAAAARAAVDIAAAVNLAWRLP